MAYIEAEKCKHNNRGVSLFKLKTICWKLLRKNKEGKTFPDIPISVLRQNDGGFPGISYHLSNKISKEKILQLVHQEISERLNQAIKECAKHNYSLNVTINLIVNLLYSHATTRIWTDKTAEPIWRFWAIYGSQDILDISQAISIIANCIKKEKSKTKKQNIQFIIIAEAIIQAILRCLAVDLLANDRLTKTHIEKAQKKVGDLIEEFAFPALDNDKYDHTIREYLKLSKQEYMLWQGLIGNLQAISRYLPQEFEKIYPNQQSVESFTWLKENEKLKSILNLNLNHDDQNFWEIMTIIESEISMRKLPLLKQFIFQYDPSINILRVTRDLNLLWNVNKTFHITGFILSKNYSDDKTLQITFNWAHLNRKYPSLKKNSTMIVTV